MRPLFIASAVVLVLASVTLSGDGAFGHPEGHGPPKSAATAPPKAPPPGDPYLLLIDPVSGKPLPKTPVVRTHEGRELRFADAASAAAFDKDPSRYLKVVDLKIVEQQKGYYPLKTCVVSGEELGAMGEPVDHVYRNRLVRLCCKDCISTLEEAPSKYLEKLDLAVTEAQAKTYPTKTCVVSGESLGSMGDPINMVVGNRLVRLCCKSCVKTFKADPAAFLAKVSG